MPALVRGTHGRARALLGAAVLAACLLLLPTVAGQVPACPALVVSANAKPLRARKPGSTFAIVAKIRNVDAAPLQNVSLRVTVPLSATLKPRRALSKRSGAARPLLVAPTVYWQGFSLAPSEGRVFKLTGKLDKCIQTGVFDVDVAAYMTGPDCSTPLASPLKVRQRD